MHTKQEIEQFLSQCYGSDAPYTKHSLFVGLVFTDAVRHLREMADCYWLIDAIASYRRKDDFQVWTLKVNDDKSAVLTMGDGNDNEEVRQEMNYTDFPLPEIQFYVEPGGYGTCEADWTPCLVLMLTTER